MQKERGETGSPHLRSWPLGRRSGRSPPLPYPPPRLFHILRRDGRSGNRLIGSRSLSVGFSPFSGFIQLAVSFGEDLFVAAFEFG